jgi:drug/metabolite transporter (DMT)-like permease
MMKREKIGIVCAVACEVLFGFSFLFSKSVLTTVSPMTLLSWRFVFAFVLLNVCAATRLIKIRLRGKTLLPLFLVALFQPVLYFVGETIGIKLTSASESGTFIACIPILTLVFSLFILKEIPRKLQVAGIIVSIAGIILGVLAKGMEATLNPLGYAMLLLAVTSASLYAVYSKKAEAFSSIEKTYAMMGLGAIVFTAVAVAENAAGGTMREFLLLPFTDTDFLIAVLYLSAGCSVAAFFLVNKAIELIGTNRTVSFVGLSTVVTVTASVILLKENYTVAQGLGTALVIAGVTMANVSRKPASILK